MSESVDGVSRSATRQKENGTETVSSFRPLAGTLNGSRTSAANATAAPGSTSAAMSEQEAGPASAHTGTWAWKAIADAPAADNSAPITRRLARTATSLESGIRNEEI